MAEIRKVRVPNVGRDGRWAPGFHEDIQLVKAPRPFQKKCIIKVTARPKRTAPIAGNLRIENARVETALFYGTTFMEAIQKAQARWPGWQISCRMDDGKPDWAKPKPKPEEAGGLIWPPRRGRRPVRIPGASPTARRGAAPPWSLGERGSNRWQRALGKPRPRRTGPT